MRPQACKGGKLGCKDEQVEAPHYVIREGASRQTTLAAGKGRADGKGKGAREREEALRVQIKSDVCMSIKGHRCTATAAVAGLKPAQLGAGGFQVMASLLPSTNTLGRNPRKSSPDSCAGKSRGSDTGGCGAGGQLA